MSESSSAELSEQSVEFTKALGVALARSPCTVKADRALTGPPMLPREVQWVGPRSQPVAGINRSRCVLTYRQARNPRISAACGCEMLAAAIS
jgi:hypothetical protein